ncbi:pyridoxal phosphate-dependent aminotransferase [Clostridium luticellarii]|jgi:aminotransferase|uniref:pyridoxal phosphate-dependent aminotransferase n=1 Tax=Clostridium luticellarii TaxID=1691940 RepID=UPI002355C6E7|nr:aminotransferase class I/II-fold pyridoxal phosphate-dependent enzyme [Clostridium luticellarii]MCI1945954.1 aminotransferase class I/II-fold pyridoxal phosphate-dependent enzyme [Clostridium luticellarii]MCI1969316.1 aminotransferase class I/II-fold pyridoxal phosphate-dependent enzyme [Clostridium luticellarii]MCI1996264.1 aminotransferase class I/II-fold pyridoxal phosphate-dependent enzyme [Clostridium luticellarii]MCI2040592.1 aminotransferase class I/II-fold pyridoxal phosphate-depende
MGSVNLNSTSKNVQSVEISGIRKFYNKVIQYPGAISLTLGQPDFNVPNKIKLAMVKAIEENKTTYTSTAGIIELREEISKYLRKLGINYTKDEICITMGGSEALMDVFAALINRGDKILIPNPAYPAYESCVKILGGNILNYDLKEDFSIDFENLEKILEDEKPKAMVLSYPSNPTGAVLSREDNEKLLKLIKKNNLIVISDEIYASLCFEKEYYSPAQYDEIKDRIILVSGFSKMFSMTGLRIGYVCADKIFMNQIIKVHQYNSSCAPSISQWGACEGLKSCMKDVDYMCSKFMERRDYIYSKLKSLGFELNLPKGAFYVFPSIEKFNMKSDEFCERLLKEAGVAIVPGSAFGTKGEGHVRISYAYSMDELKSSMGKIESWIDSLK